MPARETWFQDHSFLPEILTVFPVRRKQKKPSVIYGGLFYEGLFLKVSRERFRTSLCKIYRHLALA